MESSKIHLSFSVSCKSHSPTSYQNWSSKLPSSPCDSMMRWYKNRAVTLWYVLFSLPDSCRHFVTGHFQEPASCRTARAWSYIVSMTVLRSYSRYSMDRTRLSLKCRVRAAIFSNLPRLPHIQKHLVPAGCWTKSCHFLVRWIRGRYVLSKRPVLQMTHWIFGSLPSDKICLRHSWPTLYKNHVTNVTLTLIRELHFAT